MATHYPKRALEILREEGPVELSKRSAQFLNINSRRKLQYIKYDSVPDFGKAYSVPVSNIDYIIWSSDEKDFFGGKRPSYRIWGGEWYQLKDDFCSTFIYQSFRQRFSEGSEWENTPYYKKLKSDSDFWQVRKKRFEQVDKPIEYLNKYGEIYYDIKENGYRQDEPIQVYIGPSGEYIRSNGAHRLSCVKIIDHIETVPVKIKAIHKQWQELRDEIHNNGLPEEHEDLRDHPDLQDVLN